MITKLIKFSLVTIFSLIFLNSCNWYKRSDIKDNPVNVDERVKKNIQEGRGIRFGRGATRGGDFDFASSNPLWRGAIDVMNFVPLTNASYSGGIIITEWFSSENNSENNRELKITIQFMTNEIRADAIKVLVFEKSCNQINNCKTKRIKSKLEGELKLAILKKAALFEKDDFKKYKEEKGKKRGKGIDKKINQ